MIDQPLASTLLSGAPLYGFPQPPASRFRIAFYGDPALGAGLARRHHVIWTRPEEARHVIEQESPDLLLITARVDSLRSLRSKPLVSGTGEVSPELTTLLAAFRERGVPVVYYGLVDELEFDRYLPVALQCDAVMARSERTRDAYLSKGVARASFHELGAFGYADPGLPVWGRGGSALLRGSSAKTGGSSPGRSYATEASPLGIDEVDEGTDAIRAARTGLELVRRTAWVGTSSLQALSRMSSVLVPLKSWPTLPSNAFDAALRGVLPLLFGGHQRRQAAASRWPSAPSFESLQAAAAYVRDADMRWPRARFEATLAEVLERFLIDDWLLEAIRTTGTGVASRASATDALLLVLDPSGVTPERAAQLQDITGAAALELAGEVEGSPLDGMTFRTNVLASGSRASAAWSGRRLIVHDASALHQLQLRLLHGWARLHTSACVHLHDPAGSRVASLEPTGGPARGRMTASTPTIHAPEALLTAEPTRDIA